MDSLRRVCIAPMIDCTDRHFRSFLRLISKKVYLYTEMIVSEAICHGDHHRLLDFSAHELPLALQLGGSNPKTLVKASRIASDYGYSEINLNVGCPSDRVQAGRFGACLMKEPELVADCISEMQQAVGIPVTVKTRIGVDEMDSFEAFYRFIDTVSKAPCHVFIIHARKAWLKGLSPKENRTIPPLKYDYVTEIKKAFPELTFIINGGITDLDESGQFYHLDGIMVGREAYNNPYHLIDVDGVDSSRKLSRKAVLSEYHAHIAKELEKGVPLSYMLRHLLGLSYGIDGGRGWRRLVSANTHKTLADYEAICQAFP